MALRLTPARTRFALKPLVVACLMCSALSAQAATYMVSTEAELVAAINAVNASAGASFIEFSANIALTAALPPITRAVSILGNGKTLSGDGNGDGSPDVQLLVVGTGAGGRILVQVDELTLTKGLTKGADGLAGGDGDNGKGGALQVNSNADVLLRDVSILDNQSRGGDGSPANGSGGMGLGGGIYVTSGGTIEVTGKTTMLDNTTQGGTGYGMGQGGAVAGNGIFLEGSGTLQISTNAGRNMLLGNGIADSAAAGLDPDGIWNLLISGGGGVPLYPMDPDSAVYHGIVELRAINNYSGDTFINDVDVYAASMGVLGSGGVVGLKRGGLVVDDGVDLDRDLVISSGGGRVGVNSGEGILSGDVTGTGELAKIGTGDLVLLGDSNFTGRWLVSDGALVINSNARLGSNTDLTLSGGGLRFSDDVSDLRSFNVTRSGGYIDNGGYVVDLTNDINGWNGQATLTFIDSGGTGSGSTTLGNNITGTGSTVIESGTVTGGIARGDLRLYTGTRYNLGDQNRQISKLLGRGVVNLGAQDLTIALDYDHATGTAPSYAGNITGSGRLIVSNPGYNLGWSSNFVLAVDTEEFRSQTLLVPNSYTGGTVLEEGVLMRLSSTQVIGSGSLTLNNAMLQYTGSANFNLDIHLDSDVGIFNTNNSVKLNGNLIGNGDFLKQGTGTLTLMNANPDMHGDVVVFGSGSYVALSHEDALGSGRLVLAEGGGLKVLADTSELRPVHIANGEGVIDTGNFNVTSSGDITGATGLNALVTSSRLVKQGSGSLVLTGDVSLNGGMEIAEGSVYLGNGGAAGSFSSGPTFLGDDPDISIAANAQLVVDRSNALILSDPIVGAGELIKQGAGLLTLTGDNSFSGGLTVLQGFITGDDDYAYGRGVILLDGGGVQLNSDLSRALVLGSNHGQMQVTGTDAWHFSGELTGSGNLIKNGTGTLIYTGTADPSVLIEVAEGKFQVGEGLDGTLRGNVQVDAGATLAFARDDLTEYIGVVSGDGDVIKQGMGELVLTSDHLFGGDLVITNGTVRLGNGGSSGSLAGGADLQNGSNLIVDRSGVAEIADDLKGDGNLRMAGSGELRLPGDSSAFTGHTYIDNGSIRLNGRLGGDMDVASGALLQGAGTLGGNLNLASGARFAPGNSIGTINVGGNYAMASGSVLEIEVDDTGASDKVVVTGTATLAGELRVKPAAGDYSQPGCCTFTILTASAVSGTFDQVINDFAFINTSVNYLPTSVEVAFTRSGVSFGSVPGLTWNQQQVSAALDKLEVEAPANTLVQLVVPLATQEAGSAFNLLGGDSLLSAVNASSRTALRFNHLLTARSSRLGLASRGSNGVEMEKSLTAVRSGQMPEAPAAFAKSLDPLHYDGPTSKVEGLWLEANGFKMSEDSDDTVGSAASTFSGQLLALGIDGYWSDNFILGFGAGYATGTLDFDNRQGEGDASGQFLGSYARWESNSGWHYKAALTLAQQSTDQKRSGSIGSVSAEASSSVDVQSATAEFEAGVALHLGNYGLRPYALLDAQLLKRDAIQESGAGAADLSVDAASDVLGEIGLGIELSRPWLTSGARWAQLIAGAALLQPFGDTQREQTVRFSGASDSFTIKATPNDSAAIQLTLGGEWYLSKSVAVWGGYEGRLSSTTQEHNAVLSFQYRW